MNDDETDAAGEQAVRAKLAALRQEHQDMDAAIAALQLTPVPDQLMIMRMKRKKLALRDEITRLNDQVLPDIIA